MRFHQKGEIKTAPQTSIQLHILPVPSERALADPTDKNERPHYWSSMPSPKTDVRDRFI